MQVKAEPSVVREFERQLRLNESVLRYMTTRGEEGRRPQAPAGTPEGAAPMAGEPAGDQAVAPAAGELD
jgi:hypothetical protein